MEAILENSIFFCEHFLQIVLFLMCINLHLRPNSSCYTVNSTYYEGDGLKKVKNHMTMVGCLTEDILIKRLNVIPVNGVF